MIRRRASVPIADIMSAPPLPDVKVSRDRTTLLLSYRDSMPPIAEVAAPWIGLAGYRVRAEPENVPVGIGDVYFASAPRIIGGRLSNRSALGEQFLMQRVRIAYGDVQPCAGVPLIALAQHDRALAASD